MRHHLTELDALYALLLAAAVTALLTPVTMRLARLVGAIDEPRERGLSHRATPLLGGLAIFAGALCAGLVWLPGGYWNAHEMWTGVWIAAAVITLVGALDDRFDLHPAIKLAGQVLAALIVVHFGVVVKDITLPFIGPLYFPNEGGLITVVGLVALMNVVNFSDGVDGLAAGVCAIIAMALAPIAFHLFDTGHLHGPAPAVFAAILAGAALGFLVHNFPPASSFMGDCGSNLLGLLMGVLTVEAAVKTQVVVSFVLPLILLAVPFMDTTFVVLKRLKYKRPIYASDSEHFHHRMARIGFSSRRTIAYLYAWTLMLAGFALALGFIPYRSGGRYSLGWTLVIIALGLIVVAASVYLVLVLEILKFKRLDTVRLRRLRPEASMEEIAHTVVRDFETGEMEVVTRSELERGGRESRDSPRRATRTALGQEGEDSRPRAGRSMPAPEPGSHR